MCKRIAEQGQRSVGVRERHIRPSRRSVGLFPHPALRATFTRRGKEEGNTVERSATDATETVANRWHASHRMTERAGMVTLPGKRKT